MNERYSSSQYSYYNGILAICHVKNPDTRERILLYRDLPCLDW